MGVPPTPAAAPSDAVPKAVVTGVKVPPIPPPAPPPPAVGVCSFTVKVAKGGVGVRKGVKVPPPTPREVETEAEADVEAVGVCPRRSVEVGLIAVLVPPPAATPLDVEGCCKLEVKLEGELVPPPTPPSVGVGAMEEAGEKVNAEVPVAARRVVGVPPLPPPPPPKPSPFEGEGGFVLVPLPPPPMAPPEVEVVVGALIVGVFDAVRVPPPPPARAPEEPLNIGVKEEDGIPVPLPPPREAELEEVNVISKGDWVDMGVGVSTIGVEVALPDPPPPLPPSPPPGELVGDLTPDAVGVESKRVDEGVEVDNKGVPVGMGGVAVGLLDAVNDTDGVRPEENSLEGVTADDPEAAHTVGLPREETLPPPPPNKAPLLRDVETLKVPWP